MAAMGDATILRVNGIVGHADEPAISARLHTLRHANGIEYVVLEPADTARRRLRVATDRGTDCAIALAREAALEDGSVLYLNDERAVVVRLQALRWLTLEPRDTEAALELGYHCGNLHWKVAFDGTVLRVAIEHEEASYLARLSAFLEDGRARIVED